MPMVCYNSWQLATPCSCTYLCRLIEGEPWPNHSLRELFFILLIIHFLQQSKQHPWMNWQCSTSQEEIFARQQERVVTKASSLTSKHSMQHNNTFHAIDKSLNTISANTRNMRKFWQAPSAIATRDHWIQHTCRCLANLAAIYIWEPGSTSPLRSTKIIPLPVYVRCTRWVICYR